MELTGFPPAGLTIGGLAFCGAVLFLAGIVRGYSGFGFSAVTVAGMSFVAAPAIAVPLAMLLEVLASIFQARGVWRYIDWRVAGYLMAGGLAGNPLGVFALDRLPPDTLRLAVYGFVLAIAFVLLLVRPREFSLAPWAWLPIGFAAGIVNGAVALSGLMIVTVMTLTMTRPATMRATLIAYFFLSDIYAGGLLAQAGILSADIFLLAAMAVPPVALGIAIGSRRFLGATDAQFRRATLLLLAAISAAGLGKMALG